jgi:hypothetical protein
MSQKFHAGDLVVKTCALRRVVFEIYIVYKIGAQFSYGCLVAGRNAHKIHILEQSKIKKA